MKTSHGRSQMMRWQNGPINSPMGSPRGLASLSPRSAHVHEGYYQMAHQQHQQPGSAHFWDSFVAKQNAKALDTLSRSGHLSPRSMTPAYLSPRNRGGSISPRLMPGKTLTESLGLELPPLSPRDHGALSPRATRRAFQMHTLEEGDPPRRVPRLNRRSDGASCETAARRKAQLTSLERRVVNDAKSAHRPSFAWDGLAQRGSARRLSSWSRRWAPRCSKTHCAPCGRGGHRRDAWWHRIPFQCRTGPWACRVDGRMLAPARRTPYAVQPRRR